MFALWNENENGLFIFPVIVHGRIGALEGFGNCLVRVCIFFVSPILSSLARGVDF